MQQLIILTSDYIKRLSLYCSQFHEHFMYKFSERTLFRQLFSSYMYVEKVEKAAETMLVQKMCT